MKTLTAFALILLLSPQIMMAADFTGADRIGLEALNSRLTEALHRSISVEEVEIANRARRDKLREALASVIGRMHNGTYSAEVKQRFDASQNKWQAWLDAEIAWRNSLIPEMEREVSACALESSLTYERAMWVIDALSPRTPTKNSSKEIGSIELEPENNPPAPVNVLEIDK